MAEVFHRCFDLLCLVRKIKRQEIEKHIENLGELDFMLKTQVEKKVLTKSQGESLQATILDKLSILKRQQALMDLLWKHFDGPAFLNCSEHVCGEKVSRNHDHCIQVVMSFDSFKQNLDRGPFLDSDLLCEKGWLVFDGLRSDENMSVRRANDRLKQLTVLSERVVLDHFDVYGVTDSDSRNVNTPGVTLRMSFVGSALVTVLRKERECRASPEFTPTERLETWFRLWLNYVEGREQRSMQELVSCQIRLWLCPFEKKVSFLERKKAKVAGRAS